jgi:hypothetical protein
MSQVLMMNFYMTMPTWLSPSLKKQDLRQNVSSNFSTPRRDVRCIRRFYSDCIDVNVNDVGTTAPTTRRNDACVERERERERERVALEKECMLRVAEIVILERSVVCGGWYRIDRRYLYFRRDFFSSALKVFLAIVVKLDQLLNFFISPPGRVQS